MTNATIPAGYKQTEVGIIPEDWEVKRLGEVSSFRTGPFGSALHKSDYTYDGVPIINPMHIVDGQLIPSLAMSITEDTAKRLSDFRLSKNEIIIGRRGDMGRCAVVRENDIGWLCGTGSMIVRTNTSVNPDFIQRILASPEIIAAITETSVGSTMINLNQSTLSNLKIKCPPVEEQTAIASALSDMDALLDGLDRLITKKRNLKQAAMQQLLTGKTRLAGFEGEWEVKNLGEVANFYKGKGLPKSALDPYESQPCIHYGELFTRYSEKITETISRTADSCDHFRFLSNDVLMPTSDVTPTGLAKASCILLDNVVLGGDTLVIRANPEYIDGTFLSYVIRREENQILRLVTGTTVFHLYGSDMKKFTLAIPPIDEQKSIVEILSDMDAEIAALEQRRTKTRDIKQGMMQELLIGRTRLL